MVLPTIRLLPVIKLKREPSTFFKILTSPKTTLALAGTLAAITIPGALPAIGRLLVPKTFGGAVKTAFVAGALTAVPSLATTFNPFRAGQKAAPFIADPSKLLPDERPLKEKVAEVAKAGGLGVGVAAAIIGAGALTAKAIKKLKGGVPGLPGLPGVPGLPGAAPVALQPLGAVQPTPAPEKVVPVESAMPSINNKITFNPEINIRFSKSRKFINQQLLIR